MTAANLELTGRRFLSQHRPDAALTCFVLAGSWALAGFCCYAMGAYDQAIKLYELAPASEDNVNGIGGVILTQGKPREALQYLLEHCPQPWSSATQSNISFIYIGLGQWDVGWQLFRRMHPASLKLVDSLPEIRGQNVIMCMELGFGDFIQGLRWAPLLADFAAEVRAWVPQPLRRLVAAQGIPVIDDVEVGALIGAGWKTVPALDCPRLFGTTPDTIPGVGGYLSVPVETVGLQKLPPTRNFRVGLVWQGSQGLHDAGWYYAIARRSIPFELLAPILALADSLPVQFVSLQLPDQHRDHPHLLRVLGDDSDYLDTAAIVEQLDLIIAVDTSVAHLAGALGKPVWMLNRFAGCWRWGWQQQFDWYDSMRQYRQPAHGAWPAVIDEVVADLAGMVSA